MPASRSASAPAPIPNFLSRLSAARSNLGPSARLVADYILQNAGTVVGMSVTELAEKTGVSEGTVINLCQQLGAKGFQQLKLSLAQELVQPVHFIHEDLEPTDDIETTCRKIFHSGAQALSDTLSVLDPVAMAEAVRLMTQAKRIEVYGIGSSAPVAEDANYRLLRIGLESKVVIDSHVQAISASRTGPDVAVLTISHSGATHETLTSTRLAHEAGARTIVITNFTRSPIFAHADVRLLTMARETLFRTEAMTSRIAQLCVVDALIAALALNDFNRASQTLQETFDVLSLKRF
ncbi:MurR/RpiR family transcriptional regulator [Asticcacaulis excentricus]|uniref:MurR/RpiR family transcriptional regulator n=1 Tax=Asticcacaulis excentricus TaxID=78587 RepID=UPI000F830A98|nr:MurR/RpiR family transcriptional regulator [Asticcacaulis excentricus]